MEHFTGRAIASTGSRRSLFEDPAWDERFDDLMMLTSRTKLIHKLMGTNVTEQRLKEEMDRRLEPLGIKLSRPRGLGQTTAAKSFLETTAERFDAAYLLALHYGSRGIGEYSEVETNFAQAVDKRIRVYNKYKADAPPSGGTHRIAFETYHLLIEGIKAGDIEVRQCGSCNTKHPVSCHHQGPVHCPACVTQDLRMSDVKREMEARIAAYRAACNQQSKFG